MENYTELLTCAVCLDLYQDPVILTCLHSFCRKCTDKFSKNKESISCPICRTQSQVSAIKADFRMKEFVSLFESLKTESTNPFKICDVCGNDIDPIEVNMCNDCGMVLCMNCRLNHERGRKTKTHILYALNSKPIPYCKEHNEQLKYFCNALSCKKCICVTCAIVVHEVHEKQTIKLQTEIIADEIINNVGIIKTRLEELRSHIKKSKQNKEEIEGKFREIDLLACKKRDFIIQQANEAYQQQTEEMSRQQNEILWKVEENILKWEKVEMSMSPLLEYTKTFLDKKSFCEVNQLNNEVNNVLDKKYDIDLHLVGIDKLEFILESFDEATIKENVQHFFGKSYIKIEVENKEELPRDSLYYEKYVKPQMMSRFISRRGKLIDILYDKDYDEIYSLRYEFSKLFLIRMSNDGSTRRFNLDSCTRFSLGNYLALLPNNNLLVFTGRCILIEVFNSFERTKKFPISFCNTKDIDCICSSPCKNVLLLLSFKLLMAFKYCVKSKTCEKAMLPIEFKTNHVDTISLSQNLDYIALGNWSEIHLFSFNTQALLLSFGMSENTRYHTVAFLTENVLIAGCDNECLKIFDLTNGTLLRKIEKVTDDNDEEYKMTTLPLRISAANDLLLVFEQGNEVVKLKL